ncbi:hypothetical protein [Sutterella parvirubra]|uniref:hypothetical protein n=1 Tax=Sutterella parvirubra TaxID=437898 RepID=UPI00155AD6C4|nr:hypothetical protein [Sutterella parvirubra]
MFAGPVRIRRLGPIVGPAYFDETTEIRLAHSSADPDQPGVDVGRESRLRVEPVGACARRGEDPVAPRVVASQNRVHEEVTCYGHRREGRSGRAHQGVGVGRGARTDRFHRGPVDGLRLRRLRIGLDRRLDRIRVGAFTGGFGLREGGDQIEGVFALGRTLLELQLVVFGFDGRCVFASDRAEGPHDEVLLVGVKIIARIPILILFILEPGLRLDQDEVRAFLDGGVGTGQSDRRLEVAVAAEADRHLSGDLEDRLTRLNHLS